MEPEPREGLQWRAGRLLSTPHGPPAGSGGRSAAFSGDARGKHEHPLMALLVSVTTVNAWRINGTTYQRIYLCCGSVNL